MLLAAILNNKRIASKVYFKGGTAAMLLGWLDRFSLDLDFDLSHKADKQKLGQELVLTFKKTGFQIKEKSKRELFFILRYEAPHSLRNSLKISIIDRTWKSNRYKTFYLSEIGKFAQCQTKETMFAHKLVTLVDRYKKHKEIAGRDLYDVHYFFSQGFSYSPQIIKERTALDRLHFFEQLYVFIENKFNQKVIDQDLNYLLPLDKFKIVRKTLKTESLVYIKEEIKNAGRLSNP